LAGFFLIAGLNTLHAQQMAVADSMLREFKKETEPRKKVNLAGKLSLMYLSIDRSKADSFGRLAIEIAELSRDRHAMIKAYMYNGDRYSYVASIKDNIPKSIQHYEKAYALARESKMEKEQVSALLGLATVYRTIPEADKAMSYTAQAFAIISDRSMDSLAARCYLSFGNNYLLKKEKLLALKNFFNALRIAEVQKDVALLRDAYLELAEFYYSAKHYDKAVDYVVKATEKLAGWKDGQKGYLRVTDLNFMGAVFVQKKDYDLARKSFENSIALSDSLRYDPLKMTGYLNILNMYLIANRPAEALSYFNANPQLKTHITQMGLSGMIDYAYAYIYTDMDRLDSAKHYYERALPLFTQQMNNNNKISFFNQYAKYQFKAKNYDQAITLLNDANTIAKQMNDLEWQQLIYKQLDSAYQLKGDYKTAMQYAGISQQLKDTLTLLGREEDILQLQISDEDERQARQLKEAEDNRRRRHQFQYFAITIGIASLFFLLVLMGTFRVSATTIRILGFFTFLMFFEFLFLVFKKNIYSVTQGEPWKDLAFMIGLAALLLPLHHWAEHKLIHYLTNKHLIRVNQGRHFIRKILKSKKVAPAEEVNL
jgi:tetratricopeptide (TPR) repeat protein